MERIRATITIVGLLTGVVILLLSGTAMAQVSGSKHDISQAPYSILGLKFVCEPCHTPHNWAGTGVLPMSNREPTAQTTFTNYPSIGATPSGSDLVCLGCHDGSLAVDAFGGSPGTGGKELSVKLVGVGGNLSNAHPIGMNYSTPPTGYTDPGWPLTGGTNVGCATCHDPHDVTNAPFLRADSASLCSSCHPQ